ncbi:MAG: M48 family metalloprotease [Polyangiales bacterium]
MNSLPQPLAKIRTAFAPRVLVTLALAACDGSGGSSGVSVVEDAALSAYLQSIADEVAGDSRYRVVVYDADFAQAFALPEDEIALTLGLLRFIDNEAELACVLGHEIAHHRLGDVSDFFGGNASPPVDATHPLAQGWPEVQERGADELGISLCAAAGYEPLCAAHMLFRAAQFESGESVDEILQDDGSSKSVVDRTLHAVDLIGVGDLEGGRIGYPEYELVRGSLPGTDSATEARQSQAEGPNFFPWMLVSGVVAVGLNYDEFTHDNFCATFNWARRECGRDDVTVVPTNNLDAFGHCWAGCRAQELCGRCQNPGLYYEVAREFGYGGDEHDSFMQDWRNQEIGVRGAGAEQSCEDYCTEKIESGGLDLTAPQRKWWDCAAVPAGLDCDSDDLEISLLDSRLPGSQYTDYGALGSPDIFGDPHLVTTDGLRYDFHGVGEFVATASTVDDLVVQVRFAEVPALQASKTTAVAANISGDRVGAYLGPGRFVVTVNGVEATPSGSWVRLPNNGYVQMDYDQVVFQWPDDTRLWVYYWGNVLDLSMTLASSRKGLLAGLLGNADGDPANEHMTRDGTPVDVPDEHGDARRDALYTEFGESWRVGASESLFDYEPGESSSDFQVPGFPGSDRSIDDLNDATRQQAREDCILLGVTESPSLEECIFDIGFTGDASWANSARNAADPNSLTWNEMYEAEAEIDGAGDYVLEQFIGRAGQEQFFRFLQTTSSLDLANWELIAPSGARVFLRCVFACNQPGSQILPENGLYTSRVVADSEHHGVLRVARNVVPEPQVFNAGGSTSVALESLGAGAGSISVPGAEDIYRFDGASGTTLSLRVIEIDPRIFFGHWKLTDPNGTVLFDRILPTAGSAPLMQDLIVSGTYFLTVDGGRSWPSDQGDAGHGTYSMLLQVSPTP